MIGLDLTPPHDNRLGMTRNWKSMSALATVFLLLAGGTAVSAQTPAPSQESEAVIQTVQRLFDAMATRDTSAARSVLLPGMRFVSMATGTATARPRMQTDSAFVSMLGTTSQRYLERMWAPVVHVQGSIATLWAPYDFHLDGKWSHCGIDTAILMKTDRGWQISSLAYTVERTGCAPSPLGAPR